jgi:hypothetical protein
MTIIQNQSHLTAENNNSTATTTGYPYKIGMNYGAGGNLDYLAAAVSAFMNT